MPRLRSPRARRGRALLRIAALSLALLTLTGCSTTQIIDVGQPSETAGPELTRYQASFLDLFDTLTTVVGYAESEEEFRAVAEQLRSGLEEYHQLYDIYDEYEGINNIKTINDTAGGEPVEVDEKIIDLLLFCRDMYEATGGKLDVAMGGVLKFWHNEREAGEFSGDGELPDQAALEAAAEHCSFDAMVIDAEAGTVQITDPETRLDVGAVAKGYATEQVCRTLPEGYLVSVGGNVRAYNRPGHAVSGDAVALGDGGLRGFWPGRRALDEPVHDDSGGGPGAAGGVRRRGALGHSGGGTPVQRGLFRVC